MPALSQAKLEALSRATTPEEFVNLLNLQFPYDVEDLKLSELLKMNFEKFKLCDFTDSQCELLVDACSQVNNYKLTGSKRTKPDFVNKFRDALKFSRQRPAVKRPHDKFDAKLLNLEREVANLKPTPVQLGEVEGFSLFSAVITGHESVIKKCIMSDPAALNRKNKRGWTPLMYSLAQGCSDGTTALLKHGADASVLNQEGMDALGLGASYGHRSTVRNFLRFFRDSRGPGFVSNMLNSPDGQGRTALHYGAENRQWEVCDVLLTAGADPNVQDNEGNTPMILAVKANNSATIRLIFTRGGDVTLQNRKGESAASLLKPEKHYLIEKGPINDEEEEIEEDEEEEE